MVSDRRILVIENSVSQANALKSVLEDFRFNVTHVRSYGELDELRLTPDDYFLAITNLSIEDANSLKLLDKLLDAHIVTIVFTATVSDKLRDLVCTRPIADYIVKSGTQNLERLANTCEQIWHNQQLKVLIVEDSPAAAELMAHLTQNQGFNVTTVESAEDAHAFFESKEESIDILVLDQHLPGTCGVELLSSLRERYSHSELAIIGVSAHGEELTAVKFLKSGADDFIQKPFSPEEFICRINRIASEIIRSRQIEQQMDNTRFMLRIMGHDIRTPLNAFNLGFNRLCKLNQPTKNTQRLETIIKNSINQMKGLVETCLLFCRLNSSAEIPTETISLYDSSKFVGELIVEMLAEKDIEILNQIDADDSTVLGNTFLVNQVFQNLLSNAIKFSPPNSQITITTSIEENSVTTYVTDNGPGVDEHKQARLFEAFSSNTQGETAHSFGLGLAIVKQAIQSMGGSIAYKNSPKGGACFYFSLPLAYQNSVTKAIA